MSSSSQHARSHHPKIHQPKIHPTQTSSSDADAAVRKAIGLLNLSNGMEFSPFLIKTVNFAQNFLPFWQNNYSGDLAYPIEFYWYCGSNSNPGPNGPFLPLGDTIVTAPKEYPLNPPIGFLLFAPGNADPSCLAHPTDFVWILDDHGSGNDHDVIYWRMIPPEGYTAVGNVFHPDGRPDVNDYWCVKNDYLTNAPNVNVWSDQGTRWSHNGNLQAPVLPSGLPDDGSMWLVPPTLMSSEGGDPTWVLKTQLPSLNVQAFDPPDPAYDKNVSSGQQTDCGLQSVAIVPYTVVPADAAYPNQALSSPFYFVACEPFWKCNSTWSTPVGGSETITQTVGVSQTDSRTFTQETSFTIDCNVGLQFDIANFGGGASLTQSFTLTTETSTTGSTETQTSVSVNFPNSNLVAVWSRQKQIKLFRTDGTEVSSVVYSTNDWRLVAAPSPT